MRKYPSLAALPTFVRCKTGQNNIKEGIKGYFVLN
jgi:hypothetical protein